MLVAEAMNKNVETTQSDSTIREIARQMTNKRVGAIVITSKTGSIDGIVTERDVMSDVVAAGLDPELTKAEDIMTREVITIDPAQNLEDAADIMTTNKIKKLPVILQGKLVGIITASDLIAYEEKLVEKVAHLMSTTKVSGIGG
ncbi:MAG: CBS domain-containing protein [Candidatus Aenigmarchaeota archaeon]|nr:CBS domain-containing protein [Candidatus Aenigmarchaeota archaeon]